MCCDGSISVILSLYAVPEVTCDGAHTRLCPDSAGPPRSHPGDRPLTKSNEIILGEVMLKMNHFSLFPDGAAGTFLLDLVVWSHPSSTIGQVGASLFTGEATRPPALSLQTKAHDRKPPSNPIMTKVSPAAAAASLRIIRMLWFDFFFELLTHLRLKFHQKMLQPRSSYCLAK